MNGQHGEPASGEARSALQNLERHIFRRLGRGFLVLVPLIITLLFVNYLVISLRTIFRPSVNIIIESRFLEDVPAIGPLAWLVLVVVLVAFFYFVGALVMGGSRGRVVQLQSAILSRIPVIKTIYGVARQATDALATSQHSFSRVVLLQWPSPGITAMGFVTGHCHLPADSRTMLVVYVPTVPNPTSGMLAILAETEVIDTDITVEEAMKVIFSGGIVLPETMRLGPLLAPRQPDTGARLESSGDDGAE